MNRKVLLEEIRRRNRAHLSELEAAVAPLQAGIHLTEVNHTSMIDALEDARAWLRGAEPRGARTDHAEPVEKRSSKTLDPVIEALIMLQTDPALADAGRLLNREVAERPDRALTDRQFTASLTTSVS